MTRGIYQNLAEGSGFIVKEIIVKAGGSISLQKHFNRSEHWVVISGEASVECDGIKKTLLPNQSIFVPEGALHRLSNNEKEDLRIIEVQSGEYLSENDIVRYEDIYGRV